MTTTHVAGSIVRSGNRIRQRRGWCAFLLVDTYMDGPGFMHPETLKTGALIRVKAGGYLPVGDQERSILPADFCGNQQEPITPLSRSGCNVQAGDLLGSFCPCGHMVGMHRQVGGETRCSACVDTETQMEGSFTERFDRIDAALKQLVDGVVVVAVDVDQATEQRIRSLCDEVIQSPDGTWSGYHLAQRIVAILDNQDG